MRALIQDETTHVGDHVVLEGTRIAGEVKGIERQDGQTRVVVRVTSVLGKSSTSKAARAWNGTWVICGPEMTASLTVPLN